MATSVAAFLLSYEMFPVLNYTWTFSIYISPHFQVIDMVDLDDS